MDYWTVSCSCWRCPSPKMAVDTSSRQLKTLPISRAVVQRCVRGKVIGKLGGVSGAAVLTASSNQYLSSVLSRENLSPQLLRGFVDDVTIFLATLQTCYTLHQPLNQVLEYTSSLLITLISPSPPATTGC
ncbi:uncharacterized protein LOC135333478 isoform X1 [Halichondria panicea]|uniref:uncharacterized protein LOC135333478 isoform X1 n=1 Tax=Halichondria panicea TaxID=6063 RepID=UPI00312BB6E7